MLKLSAGERLNQVCGHAVDRHDIGQVNLGRGGVRELDLGFLGRLFQTLHRHGVLREVSTAVLVLELLHEPVDDTMVEVITAQVRIAVGSLYLEDAVTQFEHADIVRTATAVEDDNLHILVRLIQTICQGSGCRLVDNTAYIETGNLTGFLGSLTL